MAAPAIPPCLRVRSAATSRPCPRWRSRRRRCPHSASQRRRTSAWTPSWRTRRRGTSRSSDVSRSVSCSPLPSSPFVAYPQCMAILAVCICVSWRAGVCMYVRMRPRDPRAFDWRHGAGLFTVAEKVSPVFTFLCTSQSRPAQASSSFVSLPEVGTSSELGTALEPRDRAKELPTSDGSHAQGQDTPSSPGCAPSCR